MIGRMKQTQHNLAARCPFQRYTHTRTVVSDFGMLQESANRSEMESIEMECIHQMPRHPGHSRRFRHTAVSLTKRRCAECSLEKHLQYAKRAK